MRVENNQRLGKALLKADGHEDVIALFSKHGYWDTHELWRHDGDVENNWGQSGNQ